MSIDTDLLEKNIEKFAQELFSELKENSPSRISAEALTEKIMGIAMKNEALKVSLFRFVDVLPSLPSGTSVIEHVQEYFEPVAEYAPEILRKAIGISPSAITSSLIATMIRKNVEMVAKRFIIGETPEASLRFLKKIRRNNSAFTVDLLGEACLSEKESKEYLERYIELLDCLSEHVPQWSEAEPLIANHRGEETPINISVKLSALYSQVKAQDSENCASILADRLGEILSRAKKVAAFVYVDMEDTSMTSITIGAYQKLLSSAEFKNYERTGIVLQAYLRRTESDIENMLHWARKRKTRFAVRLVKGAYWDTETILARQANWPIPVWQYKESSDANYEKLSILLLKNTDVVLPAFASHNIRSLAHAICAAELLKVPSTDYELQTLYGMGEQIRKLFAKRGYLVREYTPIGKLIPGMGYLVRRLLENTSNEGFLRQSFYEGQDPKKLLKKPKLVPQDSDSIHINKDYRKTFSNCPFIDFSFEETRSALEVELEKQKLEFRNKAEIVAPIVKGKVLKASCVEKTFSPEDLSLQIAYVHYADRALAKNVVTELSKSFASWRDSKIEDRAELLYKTADLLEKRRFELTATIILEAGKPWKEADADLAEAIDFLRYYASEAKKLFTPTKLGNEPGEDNILSYEPRGLALVISPWNFPIAIPCGMFAAALVTGNCTILKPAEQTSLIAQKLFQTFLDAGMPLDVAAFLPGQGEEIGAELVDDPRVSTIVFTGSKTVGLEIYKKASSQFEGVEHVKRVIVEMGGKNAIIVDNDADLDEAVKGVVYSAFGFQGQKCSACSRAIIVGDAYVVFIERLKEVIQSISLGPASDPASYLGPVIDVEAKERLERAIEQAKKSCTLLAEGNLTDDAPEGHYVKPVAFCDIPKGHPLLTRELFGPVLAVIPAKNFDEALTLALDSEYGLTGAVFSRSPKNIDKARRKFRVGNLYINRGSTGALVMRQPFGGAKMSGVGSKAGGTDYLKQFVIPRVVTENSVRRGFAPVK